MSRVFGCIAYEHDLRLVVLAACICVLACATTVNVLASARGTSGMTCLKWLLAASLVFGGGVWSLHFVAMLAFTPELPIEYEIRATIASILVAIAGSALAFLVWRFARSRFVGTVIGGLFLGLAIGGMHYTGIGAMRIAGQLELDAGMIAYSVATGIFISIVALARLGDAISFKARIEACGWLSLGICGMHFIGMSGLSFVPGPLINEEGAVLGTRFLAVAVGTVSICVLASGLAALLVNQYLVNRSTLEARRMRLLSDLTQEALIVVRKHTILQVNAACVELFGQPADRLAGTNLLDRFTSAIRADIVGFLDGCHPPLNRVEVIALAEAGREIPVEFSCAEVTFEGRPATVIALRDLSDRRNNEAAMLHLAHHDVLTGLANRLLLRERLGRELVKAARSGQTIALLYFDLDRFKPVNDLHGHAKGDALLVQLARRLEHEVRASDTVARLGGDEFVVLATIADPADARLLASRLIETISIPFDLGSQQVEVGASLGVALYPADGDNGEALMRAADTAMYRAKQERCGSFRFYEAAMDSRFLAAEQLAEDLRHAISRGEFELQYQPIVGRGSGEVEGFEALLRWHHPLRGMVTPSEFIPLAERGGLILEIGQWVLETACAAAAAWHESEFVAVNVSPLQFREPDLAATVLAILSRTGLDPRRLEIEVTEGLFLNGDEGSSAILSALRDAGIRLSLDDFGTGYSSLSYLCNFRFDKLKIDRSFIKRLGVDADSNMIVRTIVGLAHNLGLLVVAEGVETMQQLRMVQDLGCDLAQGFLLGRPMPMDMPSELMAARARTLMLEASGGRAYVELDEDVGIEMSRSV